MGLSSLEITGSEPLNPEKGPRRLATRAAESLKTSMQALLCGVGPVVKILMGGPRDALPVRRETARLTEYNETFHQGVGTRSIL